MYFTFSLLIFLLAVTVSFTKPVYLKVSSLPARVTAFVLFPFVVINTPVALSPLLDTEALLEHENVHVAQQRELLIIGAFIVIWIELLYKRLRFYPTFAIARLNLSMEREALYNQRNPEFLANRPMFNWINYLHAPKK